MNLSQNVLLCEYSPMRKFHPYAAAAAQQGKKIYHLNIGQPDMKTPEAFFAAVRNFQQDVLAYCPSQGLPEMIEAVRQYYCKLGASFANEGHPHHHRRQRGAAVSDAGHSGRWQ